MTPLGESLLVDSGNPGERDAGRIAHVAIEVARLKQIDHYVTTHWHRDHVGGIARLAQLVPVKHYYDHGAPATLTADIAPELIEAYRQASRGKSTTLKPCDEIKLQSTTAAAPLSVRVLAANGVVLGEGPGAPQIKPCGPDFQPQPEESSTRSLVADNLSALFDIC